jgi:hypothetical protein
VSEHSFGDKVVMDDDMRFEGVMVAGEEETFEGEK